MSSDGGNVLYAEDWQSLDDCKRFAFALASHLSLPACIGLVGTLGAGKTQFVRFLVEALGGDASAVSSPTFVLLNVYQARLPISHLDLYRLERTHELHSIGFDDLVEGETICVIEWADKFAKELPPDTLWLTIRLRNDIRSVTLSAKSGSTAEAIIQALRESENAS